jgi:hypothetical protein
MILVQGNDASFVADVVGHLGQGGHQACGIAPDAHLFSELVAHRAHTVIGITAEGGTADGEEHQELVDALIAASNAPTSPRVVLVTPEPVGSSRLRRLKQSGAPYVVVSSPGSRGVLTKPTEQRMIWLSRDLMEPEHAVVTKPALLCTIATAVSEETGTGIELAVPSTSWRDALGATGIRVLAVPNWLARLAYRCGAAALYVEKGQARVAVGQPRVQLALPA